MSAARFSPGVFSTDDADLAGRWLQEPNIPGVIGTPEGFAAVETVLRQIQYGVFA